LMVPQNPKHRKGENLDRQVGAARGQAACALPLLGSCGALGGGTVAGRWSLGRRSLGSGRRCRLPRCAACPRG